MLRVDLDHGRSFHLQETELPSGGHIHHFSGTQGEKRDGPVIQVFPDHGEPWIGMFTDGDYGSPPALDRQVVALPDGRAFAVIAGGEVYAVNSHDPSDWSRVPCFPVTTLTLTDTLAVFGDFSTMCVLQGTEIRWKSKELAWDDLEIERIEKGVIHAKGYYAPDASIVPFTVDLATGVSNDAPYDADLQLEDIEADPWDGGTVVVMLAVLMDLIGTAILIRDARLPLWTEHQLMPMAFVFPFFAAVAAILIAVCAVAFTWRCRKRLRVLAFLSLVVSVGLLVACFVIPDLIIEQAVRRTYS